MCGVFRGGRMPPRKIPPAPRTRCNAPGAQAGCAFFAPGFFAQARSEEHTSELQSLMRISYAVFCLKKKKNTHCNTDLLESTKQTCSITPHTDYPIINTYN